MNDDFHSANFDANILKQYTRNKYTS